MPATLPGHGADNAILGQTLALKDEFPDARVALVSKDINLRIKAAIIGVHAEDYYSDKTIEDADLLYTGVQELPANFWERHGKNINSWQEHSRTFYRVQGPMVREWHSNQFLYQKDANGLEALVRNIDGNGAVMELVRDYRSERHSYLGHHGAQPRAELRAQPAARSGNRLRDHPRPGRHRQDAADAGGGLWRRRWRATATARSS